MTAPVSEEPLSPSSQTYAELSCSHEILWDDPDEDVNGSFWCSSCGGYFGVRRFV